MDRRPFRDEMQTEIYSALYVDFDNIYTRLKEQDAEAAEAFATHPERWLKWLEHHAVRTLYGRNVRRRILKRTCYLNPHWYDRYRPFFIRAAFTVVDCPPLTNQGKTSADIKLVMDTLDALDHRTHFDEFIFLSGDADFTPLLIRLQEHARNTLVLCVGFSSPAYTAASTWRIREDWFMQQALVEYDNRKRYGNGNYQEPNSPPENENLRQGAQLIRELVRQSDSPLSLTHLSNTVQEKLKAGPDWFGYGRFLTYLESMNLRPLTVTTDYPGYVYDPARHDEPEQLDTVEEFKQNHQELFDFASRVHRLTDMPLLLPDQYRTLVGFIVEEVNAKGFAFTDLSKNIHYRCLDQGMFIGRSDVNFVLQAIKQGGYDLSEQDGVNQKEVIKAFLQHIRALLSATQFHPSKDEDRLLMEWVMPKG